METPKINLFIKIFLFYFLLCANTNFAQTTKAEKRRIGQFTLNGIITVDGKVKEGITITMRDWAANTFLDSLDWNSTQSISESDGKYSIRARIADFYKKGYYGLFLIHAKEYQSKRILAYLEVPKDIKQSIFTLELPLEMFPDSKIKDPNPCGTIKWSNELKKFVVEWSCGNKKDIFKPTIDETITLKNIFFETDKSTLLSNSFDELKKLAAYLNKNINTAIEISGYTDNTGSEEKNKILSEARAKAVADYLISQGIDKSRTSFKGLGSMFPVANNDAEDGKQKNRRVEFIIKNK